MMRRCRRTLPLLRYLRRKRRPRKRARDTMTVEVRYWDFVDGEVREVTADDILRECEALCQRPEVREALTSPSPLSVAMRRAKR